MDRTKKSVARVYSAMGDLARALDGNAAELERVYVGFEIDENYEIENIEYLCNRAVGELELEGWLDLQNLRDDINALPPIALGNPKSPNYADARERLTEGFLGTNFEWLERKIGNLHSSHTAINTFAAPKEFYDACGDGRTSFYKLSEAERQAIYAGYWREKEISQQAGEPPPVLPASQPFQRHELQEGPIPSDSALTVGAVPEKHPVGAGDPWHEERGISDRLAEMVDLDLINESIAGECDPTDDVRLAENHGRIANALRDINSLRSQAILKNPHSKLRVSRSIPGSLTTRGATERPPETFPQSNLGDPAELPSNSRKNPSNVPHQIARDLDVFLLDLRDRLARIDLAGDRELPNLQIVVNNQAVYHRLDGVPQRLPAQIGSEDIAYLDRAINSAEGTKDATLNRDVRIKVDGQVVFELVGGQVTKNLLPQGQRRQEQGVVIGVSAPNELTSIAPELEPPVARSLEQGNHLVARALPIVDNNEFSFSLPVEEPVPEPADWLGEGTAVEDKKNFPIIKDSNLGLILSTAIDDLPEGQFEVEDGIGAFKASNLSTGASRVVFSDFRDPQDTVEYELVQYNNGDLGFSKSGAGQILSVENGRVCIHDLDDLARSLIKQIEKFHTQQSMNWMNQQDRGVEPILESKPFEQQDSSPQPKRIDKQDEIEF